MSVIEGFLVRLGFDIDQDGQLKFGDAIENARTRLMGIGKAAVATGAAITAAFTKASYEVNDSFNFARSVGSSIKGISTLEKAVERVGGSAESVRASFSALADKLKLPNARELYAQYGVEVMDETTGHYRDTSEIFLDLTKKIRETAETQGVATARSMAEAMGLGAVVDDILKAEFLEELERAAKFAGVFSDEIQDGAKASHRFSNEASTSFALVTDSVKAFTAQVTETLGLDTKLSKFNDDLAVNLQELLTAEINLIKDSDGVLDFAQKQLFDVLDYKDEERLKRLQAKIDDGSATQEERQEYAKLAEEKRHRDVARKVGGSDEKAKAEKWADFYGDTEKTQKYAYADEGSTTARMAEDKPTASLDEAEIAEQMKIAEDDSDVARMIELTKAQEELRRRKALLSAPPEEVKPTEVKTVIVGDQATEEQKPSSDGVSKPVSDPVRPNQEPQKNIPARTQPEQALTGKAPQPKATQVALTEKPQPPRDLPPSVSGVKPNPQEVESDRVLRLEPESLSIKGSPFENVRGIRNNNPGNLEASRLATGREEGHGGRFVTFETPELGYRAMAEQLKAYQNAGLENLASIIGKWAPGHENNTGAYIQSVAKQMTEALGVDVGARSRLNLSDPAVLKALTDAMINQENGMGAAQYFQGSAFTAAIEAAAASTWKSRAVTAADKVPSRGQTINVTQNIHIDGAQDPALTGRKVAEAGMSLSTGRNLGSNLS